MDDPVMDYPEMTRQLNDVLGGLLDLLNAQGLRGQFPSLDEAYRVVHGVNSSPDLDPPKEALAEARSLILSCFTGTVGSLSDLALWAEPEGERIVINTRLQALRARLKELARQLPLT